MSPGSCTLLYNISFQKYLSRTVCNSPSAGSGPDIPIPANATNVSKIGGIISFKSSDAPEVVASFFKLALPPKGWAIQAQNAAAQYTILIFMNSDTEEILQIMIQGEDSGSNTTVTLQGN